jgi:hypothetical protein
LLLLLSLAVVAVVLCMALRERFAFVLPVLASAAVLLLYPLAMADALAAFPWLLYAAALLGLGWVAWAAAHGRGAALFTALRTFVLTPALLAFVLLAALLIGGQRAHGATAPDELRYFAIEAKSLFAQGGLANRALHLTQPFQAHPPGMQLFQWLGAVVASACGDGLLFSMLNVFYAIYLLPLAACITWRRVWLLPLYLLLAVALPTAVSRDAYAMLRVDAATGVCLGYCLVLVWRQCRSAKVSAFDAISLGLGLFVLALLTQAGIVWALMPVTLLLLQWRGFERPVRAARWLAVAAPLLAFGSWQLYCLLDGLPSLFATGLRQTVALWGAAAQSSAALGALPAALWRAASQVLIGGEGGVPSPLFGLPLIGWAIVLPLLPLLLALVGRHTVRRMVSVSLWLGVCLIGFTAAFALFSAAGLTQGLQAFISGDAAATAYRLERYASPGLIGTLMLLVAMVQVGEPIPRRRLLVLTAALAVLLLCTANWRQVQLNLFTGGYPLAMTDEIVAVREGGDWPATAPAPQREGMHHAAPRNAGT